MASMEDTQSLQPWVYINNTPHMTSTSGFKMATQSICIPTSRKKKEQKYILNL